MVDVLHVVMLAPLTREWSSLKTLPLYKGECPTGEGNVIFLPGFHPADRNDVPARFVILVCILPTKILSLQGNSKLIADY